MAEAKVISNHAVGPLAGEAHNVALLSYLSRLDMGIDVDRSAIREPALLTRCTDDAVSGFVAFAG